MSQSRVSPDQIIAKASEDYIKTLVQYLEAEEFASAALVSLSWCARFAKPAMWKKLFQSQSKIPIELMNEFEADVFEQQNGLRVDWRLMCKNAEALKKNVRRLNFFYWRFHYQSPSNHLVLLTLCLNNEAYASQALKNKDDAFGLYCLSLYGNLNNVVRALGRRFSLNHDGFITAIWAGNLEMVKELYEGLKDYLLAPIDLANAISSGNVRLVEWMLQVDPMLIVNSNNVYAMGGNPQMMRFVFDAGMTTLQPTFMSDACESGAIFPVDYICALFGKELSEDDLPFVIAGGNQRFVEILLARFQCAIRPDYLVRAHESGNFSLFRFLFEKAFPNFMQDRDALLGKASDGDAAAKKELAEANQTLDEMKWSGRMEFIRFYHEELRMPITKKVFLEVLCFADDLQFDYIRTRSNVSFNDISENFRSLALKFQNKSLGATLRSCSTLQSLFGMRLDSFFATEYEHPRYVFAALDMLLHPKWYDLDERKMHILLLLLEYQLPIKKSEFALIERHKARTLLSRLQTSHICKTNTEFERRIGQLQKLFVNRTLQNNFLL